MQLICQFDDENLNILVYCDDYFVNGFSFCRIFILDFVEFSDFIDEKGDFFIEISSELFVGVGCVFDGVVQEVGVQSLFVYVKFSEDYCYCKWMCDVGVIRFMRLFVVVMFSSVICLFDDSGVGFGVVGQYY